MGAEGSRKEAGEEKETGRKAKGRLIQKRDQFAMAVVGMSRVVREATLARVVFPGRDAATFANRVWELARDLEPVGAFWEVHKRTRDDGSVERYLALTAAGYVHASRVLGRRRFDREPTDPLKPSHVLHDLDLADFALSLFPTRAEQYQPLVRGRPSGPPIPIAVPYLGRSWSWLHHSVCKRLVVLEGKKSPDGTFAEKPRVALVYEPDAILETSTFNCTRYFIEWDRGTEALAGAKEERTITDKLGRIRGFFWESLGLKPGTHWTRARSHYLLAFKDREPRRPKVLIITQTPKRADNIRQLATRFFGTFISNGDLASFLEVATVEEARAKLLRVCRAAESAPLQLSELPWERELRVEKEKEEAARAKVARRDPLWVPYRPAGGFDGIPAFVLEPDDAQALLTWSDAVRSRGTVGDYADARVSTFALLERIRAAVSPSLTQRAGALVGLASPPTLSSVSLSSFEQCAILEWLATHALRVRDRTPKRDGDDLADRNLARIVTKLIFNTRAHPKSVGNVILWAKGKSPTDSPWSPPEAPR